AGQRRGQLLVRLVVAVEDDAGRREAGREGDVELAAGGDVEVEAFLGYQPDHRPAKEGLSGVGHAVGAESGDVLPAANPQVGLVVDEQRRTEPLGQLAHVAAADRQPAAGRDGGGGGQEPQVDRGAQEAAADPGSRPGTAGGSAGGAGRGAGGVGSDAGGAGRGAGAAAAAAAGSSEAGGAPPPSWPWRRASSAFTRAMRSRGSKGLVT